MTLTPPDEALAFEAQEGNMQALAALVERHKGRVYRTLYQVIGNAQDAEDLSQEVFVKLFRSLNSYRGDAAFTTWLHRLTLNQAFDWLRARKRRPLTVPLEPPGEDAPEPALPVASPTEGPEEVALRSERREQLRQAIEALAPEYRDVVLLYHFHHLSYQQIGDRLDLPVRTVETRLYRARAQLRKRLMAMEGGDGGGVQGGSPPSGRVLGTGART